MYFTIQKLAISGLLLLLFLISPMQASQLEELSDSTTACIDDQVTNAVFSQDGQQIITSSHNGIVRLWDDNMASLISSYTDPKATSLGIAVPQAGDFIVVSDLSDITNQRTSTTLLDKAGAVIRQVPGSYGTVLGSDLLLTNGGGETARLWDIATGSMVRTLEHPFYNPVVSPNGQWVLTVPEITSDYTSLWAFPGGDLMFTFPDVNPMTGELGESTFNHYSEGAFSSDNQWVALSSGNSIFLWSLLDLSLATKLNNEQPISSMVFSNSDQYLLVGGKGTGESGGRTTLWDLKIGNIIQEFPAYTKSGDVQSVAFSPDGSTILIVHDDNRIRTWSVATGRLLSEPSVCLSNV